MYTSPAPRVTCQNNRKNESFALKRKLFIFAEYRRYSSFLQMYVCITKLLIFYNSVLFHHIVCFDLVFVG